MKNGVRQEKKKFEKIRSEKKMKTVNHGSKITQRIHTHEFHARRDDNQTDNY